MKIKDLPNFNKPSSKLQKSGAESLDTAELLSIIFWAGERGNSALELSNRILKKYNLFKLENLGFNHLINIIKAPRKTAEHKDYIKAMQLLSLFELSKRYNKLKSGGYKRKITCAKDVYDLLVDRYGSKKKEYFICLYLDTKNNVIKEEVVSVGTLNSSLVHPREVFKTAIRESANSLILVHNHPSGDVSPSVEDIEISERIIESGKLLNVKVLDHIVIGKSGYWSMSSKD
jgi:DNA repair protein RadC